MSPAESSALKKKKKNCGKKKENNLLVTTNQFQQNYILQHEKKKGTYLFDQASPAGVTCTLKDQGYLKKAGSIISIDPPICIPVCLGQTVSLSLALAVRWSQSRVTLHQVRGTWQLWSGVHHGSTTRSHPRGHQLLFMESDLFCRQSAMKVWSY